MTTEAEARAAILNNAFLTRIKANTVTSTVEALTDILTGPDHTYAGDGLRGRINAAEEFRNYLWFGPVQGGVTSAHVTLDIFTALGRGDECDPNWI